MDKNAIKKYAVWARQELLRRVAARAEGYGVSKDECLPASADAVRGRLLTPTEKTQRQKLLAVVRKNGYEQVIEEAAYTWFNRLIALRFLEVNGYLPSHVRVFTNEAGGFQPQILAEALHLELPGLDQDRVIALKQANDEDGLYKYLLITQCNALSAILPGMFQKIEDYTELLFPDHVLRNGSVIERMVHDIPESDWKEQVQIIGWLYQYYNTEPKDQVFADLKKNIKITKEKIPAATQLFTPDWIVRYMVENSLGRIFINGQLSGMGDGLSEPERIEQEKQLAERMGWRYYLPEAEQTPEVRVQLRALAAPGAPQTAARCPLPTLIDPCMGSGHILAYAFDLLMQLYLAYGYTPRDAVRCILQNNLYGLDIDERAAQLAYFSVMMKAVQYDPRFLRRSSIPQPHVFAIAQSNGIDKELLEYFANGDAGLQRDIETIMEQLQDAKEYGSLLTVSPADFGALYARFDQIIDEVSIHKRPALEELLPVVQTAELLAGQYDIVCTNPPYMAVSNASPKTQTYAKNCFPDAKSDLFACFILRCGQLARQNGYQAMITQHAWMFLSSYEKLRARLQAVDTINMAHLGARAFDEIGGEVVQTTSFVMRQSYTAGYKGTYCRLVEPNTQQGKEASFLAGESRYTAVQDNFFKIPGAPIAYWVSEKFIHLFEIGNISEILETREGLSPANSERFLRFWYEISKEKQNCKWFPYQKGGDYNKWYGNHLYVVNWENDGYEIKNNRDIETGRIRSHNYNGEFAFAEGLTWTAISSSAASFRYVPVGFLFDSAGSMGFARTKENLLLAIGVLNTKIALEAFRFISPTIKFMPGQILQIPYKKDCACAEKICDIVEDNIRISEEDWDSYEMSWNYLQNPII